MAWIHSDGSKSGRCISVPLNEDAVAVLRVRLSKHDTFVFTYRGIRCHYGTTMHNYARLIHTKLTHEISCFNQLFKWRDRQL